MAKNSIEQTLSVLEAGKANLSPEQCERLAELVGEVEGVRKSVSVALETSEKRELAPEQQAELLSALEVRFSEKPEHYEKAEGVDFSEVKKVLEANPEAMYSLARMENTGGLPDIIADEDDAFVFRDCSDESPRRGLTHDQATKMAKEFGVDMVPEDTYRKMQETGKFDLNTWSWLATPADIRESGDALYGRRVDPEVRVRRDYARYHFDLRGWRGELRVPKA